MKYKNKKLKVLEGESNPTVILAYIVVCAAMCAVIVILRLLF